MQTLVFFIAGNSIKKQIEQKKRGLAPFFSINSIKLNLISVGNALKDHFYLLHTSGIEILEELLVDQKLLEVAENHQKALLGQDQMDEVVAKQNLRGD